VGFGDTRKRASDDMHFRKLGSGGLEVKFGQ